MVINDKNGYLAHAASVDLRRRYIPPMSNTLLSHQISATSIFYLPMSSVCHTSKSMWDLARKFKELLTTSLDDREMFASGLIYGKFFEISEGAFSTKRSPTSWITSWGYLNFQKQYGQWKLEGMIPFINVVRVFTPHLMASTVNGVPVPVFSSTILEKIQNDTMQYLRQMIVDE